MPSRLRLALAWPAAVSLATAAAILTPVMPAGAVTSAPGADTGASFVLLPAPAPTPLPIPVPIPIPFPAPGQAGGPMDGGGNGLGDGAGNGGVGIGAVGVGGAVGAGAGGGLVEAGVSPLGDEPVA